MFVYEIVKTNYVSSPLWYPYAMDRFIRNMLKLCFIWMCIKYS